MHHDDPWIVEMLWQIERRPAIRCRPEGGRACQGSASQPTGWSEARTWPRPTRLGHFQRSLDMVGRLRRRLPSAKVS